MSADQPPTTRLRDDNDASHDSLRSLLGAYAVHALDSDEFDRVREHLEHCDNCRNEVEILIEAAASIALTAESDAAPGVWENILTGMRADVAAGQIAEAHARSDVRTSQATNATTNVVDLASHPATKRRMSWRSAAAGAAAAIALTVPVMATLGGGSAPSIAALAADASKTVGARIAPLKSPDGVTVAEVVLTRDGKGYVRSSAFAPLDDTKTYQLWAIVNGEPVSAGLLGTSPKDAAFTVTGDVAAMAVSVEPATGVKAPSAAPIAVAAFA